MSSAEVEHCYSSKRVFHVPFTRVSKALFLVEVILTFCPCCVVRSAERRAWDLLVQEQVSPVQGKVGHSEDPASTPGMCTDHSW